MAIERGDALAYLLAAGGIGIGLMLGGPAGGAAGAVAASRMDKAVEVLSGVVGNVAVNWLSDLSLKSFAESYRHWSTRNDALNHHLQRALRAAIVKSVQALERDWARTDEGAEISRLRRTTVTNQQRAQLVTDTFAELREAAKSLSDTAAQSSASTAGGRAGPAEPQTETVLALLDRKAAGGALLPASLAGVVESVSESVPGLADFLDQGLPQAISFFFIEELKDPKHVQAWRALQLLLHDGTRTALQGLLQSQYEQLQQQGQTLEAVRALQQTCDKLTTDIAALLAHRAQVAALPELERGPGWNEAQAWLAGMERRLTDAVQSTGDHIIEVLGSKIDDLGGRLDTLLPRPPIEPVALPLDAIPPVGQLPPGYRMELPSSSQFQGRDDDLRRLARTLSEGHDAAVTGAGRQRLAAATGIGGIGKTQLAIEFVWRYGPFFTGGVFWLSAADAATLDAAVAACGGPAHLNLPAFDGLDFPTQVQRVRDHWERGGPYLLVLDNCEEPELVRRVRPLNPRCHLLLTSRRLTWHLATDLGIAAVPLDELAPAAALALLQQLCGQQQSDATVLAQIAEAVGYLPLALHIAGSLLSLGEESAEEYLSRLHSDTPFPALTLDDPELRSPTAHEQNVWNTFALSYETLKAADPTDALALRLLVVCGYYAPGEIIPAELLARALGDNPEHPGERSAVARAVRRLGTVGLVERLEQGAVRLHRLVAAFARAHDMDHTARATAEGVLAKVAYDANASGLPERMRPWLPHLRAAAGRAFAREDTDAATLLSNLGYYLTMTGDYAGARPLYERALAITERVLGPDHPATATSLNNLASLLRTTSDYAAAQPFFERALAIRERVLGPDHPDTATSLNNLASLEYQTGNKERARDLVLRAVRIANERLGREHPTTQLFARNLFGVLAELGELPVDEDEGEAEG